MTRMRRDGTTEYVKLGPLERSIGGLVVFLLLGGITFIGKLVWDDHEHMAAIDTRLAVLESRAGISRTP